MEVYCVFQTVDYPTFDEQGEFQGIEQVSILEAIFIEYSDAILHIKKHPELKLHQECWKLQ